LVSIAVSDPFFTLNGKSLIGLSKEEVLAFFTEKGIEISNEEDLSDDENPDLELLESEDLGFMIWFADGEAIEIQILPDVEEDGETIKWPA